jgi:3-oxoacid CoA-transferase
MLWASFRATHPLASLSLRIGRRAYSTPVEGAIPKVNKVWDNVDDAVKAVKSGDTLLSGGTRPSLL